MLNSKRKKIVGGIIAALVIVGGAAFAVGPPPPKSTTDQAQVFASGAETIEVSDPVHERPVTMSHWSSGEGDRSHLVVISHGFSADRTSHDYLAEELTSQGYTVIAPTHPDIAGLESGDPRLDPLALRPRHLSLAIDAAEAELGGSFDNVTVLGFSLGGYSALRIAGAEVSLEGAADHCATFDDPILCTPRARDRFLALQAGAPTATDDRVTNIVLLAPGYGPLFSEETLSAIEIPVLIVQAADDTEVVGDQVDDLAKGLPGGTETHTFAGGHFDAMRLCTAEERAAAPYICTSADGVDRPAVHADLVAKVSAFLDR